MHDPVTYANPMEFNPERFLGDNPEPDPRATVFGFGRRICECRCFVIVPHRHLVTCVLWTPFRGLRTGFGLSSSPYTPPLPPPNDQITDPLCWVGPGLNLAQTSVWLTCAMSLAAFDIEKYVDAFGNVVEPRIHYSDGILR